MAEGGPGGTAGDPEEGADRQGPPASPHPRHGGERDRAGREPPEQFPLQPQPRDSRQPQGSMDLPETAQ